MNKALKIVVTVLLTAALIFTVLLSASASAVDWFTLTDVYWLDSVPSPPVWRQDTSATLSRGSDGSGTVTIHSGAGVGAGFRFTLKSEGYVKIQSGYYFLFSMTLNDTYTESYPNTQKYVSIDLIDGDGITHQLPVVLESSTSGSTTSWTASAGFRLDADHNDFRFGSIVVQSNFGADPIGNYTINTMLELTTSITPEQKRHEELMQGLDDVKQSVDDLKNEDYGYETPDEQKEVMNGLQGLTSQVNELNKQIEDSKNTINDGAEKLIDSATQFGNFINGFFNGLPIGFISVLVGLLILLLVRKAVGR